MKDGRDRASLLGSLSTLEDLLNRSGETFDVLFPDQRPGWTPDWVPKGYTHIAWEVFSPAEMTWIKHDEVAREQAFISAIERASRMEDKILLVYEGARVFFRLSRPAVLRHASAVLDHERISGSPLWITSPPAQWLVEVTSEMVTVGEPLPASSDENELAVLQATLDSLKLPYDLWEASRDHPALPNVPLLPAVPPLRATIPNEDKSSIMRLTKAFVDERPCQGNLIQLIASDTHRIHLSRPDFLTNIEEIITRAVSLNISAPTANWSLGVRRRLERTWIEGTY